MHRAISDEPVASVDQEDKLGFKNKPVASVDQEDKLGFGFNEYASSLSDIIINSDPEFTIGILGEWGTGKTTLMKKIANILEKYREQGDRANTVVSVWFNAWRCEREQHHAIIPLLETIRYQIRDRPFSDLSKLRRALGKTVSILRDVKGSISFGFIGVPVTIGNIGSPSKSRLETIYHGELGSIERTFDKINSKRKAKKEAPLRIVIFIDDLDRCAPDTILEVLESVKVFLSMKGFVYVIGVSSSVIEKCISKKYEGYGITGNDFMKKFIQIPFHLPEWEDNNLTAYVNDIIKKTDSSDQNLFKVSVELIISGIQKNPREIKRFMNSFIPIKAVFDDERIYDPEILMLLHIFHFRWPHFYNAIFDSRTLREDLNAYLDSPVSDLFHWNDIEDGGKKVREFLAGKFGKLWVWDARIEKLGQKSFKFQDKTTKENFVTIKLYKGNQARSLFLRGSQFHKQINSL